MENNNEQNIIQAAENLQQNERNIESSTVVESSPDEIDTMQPNDAAIEAPANASDKTAHNDSADVVSAKIDEEMPSANSSGSNISIDQIRKVYDKRFTWLSAGLLLLLCALLAFGIFSWSSYRQGLEQAATQLAANEEKIQELEGELALLSEQSARNGNGIDVSEMYNRVVPQTISVKVYDPKKGNTVVPDVKVDQLVDGSGFFISHDGMVVTNYHVISDGIEERKLFKVVLCDGSVMDAKVIGYDESRDIAVLKIEGDNYDVPEIADLSSLKVGDRVYAVGAALGKLYYSLSTGYVSALDRIISPLGYGEMDAIQLDISVNEGNSGGPVFNERGELVGLILAKFAASGAEGLAFIIPIDKAEESWTNIINSYVPDEIPIF